MFTPLFDRKGLNQGFIENTPEQIIYLHTGEAVAYLIDNSKIYGFNGLHLGWFVHGTLYNTFGIKEGFIKDTCPRPPQLKNQPFKAHKMQPRVKRVASMATPMFKLGHSEGSFEVFLKRGQL